MTEVVRTKVRSITVLTTTLILAIIAVHLSPSSGHAVYSVQRRKATVDLLQFGNKCSNPSHGVETSIVTECDASKGLVCDGTACVCTFAEHYAYDPFSDECRKKLGKSCRVTENTAEYLELPFHQKCHSTANCIYVARGLKTKTYPYDMRGKEEFAMCVCKKGMEPTQQLDGCRVPRPDINLFSSTKLSPYTKIRTYKSNPE